jgi:molybdenum cofactor cytidylyltransferase
VIAGVLLAAGESRRMGRDKALVRSAGRTFTAHGLHHLWSACDAVVIVLGARAPRIRAAIEEEFEHLVGSPEMRQDLAAARRHCARGLEARFVLNRAWRSGMLGSVKAGLKVALGFRPESILVLPVDHPRVRPRTVQALATTMREALSAFAPGTRRQAAFAYALVPRHRRQGGHPIALSSGLARAIVKDRAATTLSEAVRRNSRLVGYFDTPDPGVLDNRNTPSSR